MVFAAFAFMWISTIASFAETINYTYDDMLRLIKAQYGDGTTVDYTYDSLGNRLIKTTTLPGAPTNTPPAWPHLPRLPIPPPKSPPLPP
jgi:YD repeat-containing protein